MWACPAYITTGFQCAKYGIAFDGLSSFSVAGIVYIAVDDGKVVVELLDSEKEAARHGLLALTEDCFLLEFTQLEMIIGKNCRAVRGFQRLNLPDLKFYIHPCKVLAQANSASDYTKRTLHPSERLGPLMESKAYGEVLPFQVRELT